MSDNKKPKLEVFKFQASQFPYHTSCLVYNERRNIQGQYDMTGDMAALFDKHGEKFYAKGYYDTKEKKVVITGDDAVVKNPGW